MVSNERRVKSDCFPRWALKKMSLKKPPGSNDFEIYKCGTMVYENRMPDVTLVNWNGYENAGIYSIIIDGVYYISAIAHHHLTALHAVVISAQEMSTGDCTVFIMGEGGGGGGWD